MMKKILILIGFLLIPGTACAIIDVPGDYPTIQQALNFAADAETVLVQPGIYRECISLDSDKEYNLVGINRDTTIIDGMHSGTTVGLWLYYEATISNLTIINSVNDGIHAQGRPWYDDRLVHILNCVVKDNAGYGIYLNDKEDFYIENCTITNNEKRGIYAYLSQGIVQNNLISCNNGGIYGEYFSKYYIYNNTIEYNIADNPDDDQGAAIFTPEPGYLDACFSFDIRNNIIQYNESQGDFIVRVYYQLDGYFINNFVYRNSSRGTGGTIKALTWNVNNTVVENTSTLGAGGFLFGDTMINNIIVNNSNYGILAPDREIDVLKNNDIYGNSPAEVSYGLWDYSDITDINNKIWGSENNISCDPGFIAPGDYHLSDTSCCINKGTSDDAPLNDLDNDTRPIGPAYDIGADEYVYFPVPISFSISLIIFIILTMLYLRSGKMYESNIF
ncbi:MAG: hypothetical protein A2161_03755 [Candidatus Schekmanbacteria bacterium RBG_13_48_7]|uniref:Right handed beta helix domain-containing protein n=1 Tax=Candidatus Schekmanbacteria bacterium RBG_13_48_7 TaxID=1817878 RepID=A0A1F7RXR3_9BACT|nr:MAG: hypothetical protein A2161_03755 [Candidatus Schekmanbacteria bacterium RBG_13_48_7]